MEILRIAEPDLQRLIIRPEKISDWGTNPAMLTPKPTGTRFPQWSSAENFSAGLVDVELDRRPQRTPSRSKEPGFRNR